MTKVLLSFIIPMYNVEKYIARCLDSLLNQDISYEQYEIIVVDDGSYDDSIQIVQKYQNKYKNINLLIKENGGASSARNYAFDYCIGEYIWMVDSDDKIKENCLKGLLEYANKYQLDFVSFPIKDVFTHKNKITVSNKFFKPKQCTIVDNLGYLNDYYVEHSPCTFIVKKIRLLENNVRFIEGITQEDFDFVIRLLENCKRISSYHAQGALYDYFIGRIDSVSTKVKTNNYSACIKTLDSFYISILTLMSKYPNVTDKYAYSYYANFYINNIKCYALSYLLYFPLPYKDKVKYLHKYKNELSIHTITHTKFLSNKIKMLVFIYRRYYLYKLLLILASLFHLFKVKR